MLEEYRKEIDAIDKRLLNLLAQRNTLVQRIGDYKKERRLPIRDDAREKEVVARMLALNEVQYHLNPEIVKAFMNTLFKISDETEK